LARSVPLPAREAAQAERPPSPVEARSHDVAALAPPAPPEDGKRDVAVPAPGSLDVDWPIEPMARQPAPGQVGEAVAGASPSMTQTFSGSTASRRPERPSRTVPPLTIQASDEDAQAQGVPRNVSPLARVIVGGSVAVAAGILLVGFLSSTHARQLREAEEARSAAAAFAAAAPMPSAVSPVPNVPPLAPPEVSAIAAVASVAKDQPHPGESDEVAAAKTPKATATPVVHGVAAAARVPAPPVERGESALVAKFDETGQSSMVLEAERALARGATARAVELAQKAVAENPGDADAWLTLGAAREASGDANSARLAYRSCVAQAHTVGLDHCRVLAERQAGN